MHLHYTTVFSAFSPWCSAAPTSSDSAGELAPGQHGDQLGQHGQHGQHRDQLGHLVVVIVRVGGYLSGC